MNRRWVIKWFKHDSDANTDAKLQNVLLDYGLEGYGLYWYCLELIAGRVSAENISFELEHDARIIARNVGSTAQKVSEMMEYFVNLGLFECSEGAITCLKMAKRLDQSMTSNANMRNVITRLKTENHDAVMISHDAVMQEEKRREEKRLDKKRKYNKDLFDFEAAFAEFWGKYPKKTDKANALKRFKSKCKSEIVFAEIMQGLNNHLPVWDKTEPKFIPHASTWLNGERWNDEIDTRTSSDKAVEGFVNGNW